jgi:molybdopterin converting factor subunit 1
MKIDVKMFAAARQYTSQAVVQVELEDPACVASLKQALLEQYPALGPLASHLLIAVDNDYAEDDCPLDEQSEIAVIPPVSGG